MGEAYLQEIYINKLSEGLSRLIACELFLDRYYSSDSIFEAEAAILQIRKAMECVAYAAVAPNKSKYAEFRSQADKAIDFTKDFHAGTILKMLSKINPDFYPKPVSAPLNVSLGKWHFDRRNDKSLSQKQFESFYDRLGKLLHADNPWGNEKGLRNLLADIPSTIESIRLLLSLHFTVIRTSEFNGVWIVESPNNGQQPRVIVGQAIGEFAVEE
uniref:HEPN AbiU2-like domain-containing protein n=1 Tax=Chlorobium chlorochromatii (strain CaD3) TaxID=340177 RepID=Q3APK4_CHLCH